MELRSKSCRHQSLQEAPRSMQDLRCYSVSYAGSSEMGKGREMNIKKVKGNSGKSTKSWSFSDPELQRKKRVAGYKVYAVEGKMKGSLRKSFKWIKNTYSQAVQGWW